MRIKLEQRWIDRLCQLPESGMGYQRVDLRLADGRTMINVPVFNAEEAELPEDWADAKIEDVSLHHDLHEAWEEATSDFVDRYDRNLHELAELLKQSGGKGRVPWKKIPAARLKRIWLDYGKTLSATTSREGIVRDEKGLEEIADTILDNIARLRAATEMMGHTSVDARQMLDDMGYAFTDQEWDDWMTNYFTDERGNWTLSDYGLPKLEALYAKIYGAESAEEKLRAIDQALHVVHQRSDLAALFVEGGSETLREIFDQGGYVAEPEPVKETREEPAEEFDPDMPTHKLAKDFALGLDKRGEERIKELEKFSQWQGGDWVIPHAYIGYEADFDNQANHGYFKEKYPWLRAAGQTLGFDDTKFPEEYDSFELFIGQIDQTEWESFIEDVGAVYNGICMDDDKAMELENEESAQSMKAYWLPEIKKRLLVDPRFQEPELQKEIPQLTTDDLWKFAHEYYIYPEREGYGNVTFDIEHIVKKIQPEDILGVGKPPKEHPEFKFESHRLNEADPDDVDPRAYLGRVSTYWGVAYDGTDDKPGWTPQPHWHSVPKKLVWYTGDPWDRWSFYAEDAKQFKSKEAADSFINVIAADKKDWPNNMVAAPLPEFWQEAVDPDAVDPRAYMRGIQPYFGIALWTKGSASEGRVWYTNDSWDEWSDDPKDAKKFASKAEADRFLELNFSKAALQPGRFNTIDIEILPGLWQEALDPDVVDPREYLRSVSNQHIIKHPTLTPDAWWKKNLGWIHTRDRASRFPTPEAAQEFARSGEFEAGYWDREKEIIIEPWLRTAVAESDPDVVDPREYLKHLRRGYVARAQAKLPGERGGLEPVSVWFNDKPWGWWASASGAKVFDNPQEAERARMTLPKDKQALMVVEPHEEIVQEALDPDAISPKEYLKHLSRGSIIKLLKLNGEVKYYDSDHGQWWTPDKSKAHVFKSEQEAKKLVAEMSVVGVHSISVIPVEEIMQEARIQRKQLPPEEEIDYKKWALHGGYDSGTEIYSDANVRIFRPSTMETWEKYMVRPSRDWASFEEPGPIFIVIPAKGKPWAFREYYDEIVELNNTGGHYNTPIHQLLKDSAEGARVGPVMAAYYKKKLKQDFDKYFPWVFEFGGLKAVRGYLHRIKPGDNDAIDNAIAIYAAETGNLALASKFFMYPKELMSKKGVWIGVDDWQNLTKMFKDTREANYQKSAEQLFGGESQDWFYWLWETPVDVDDVTKYLTPEHFKQLREALVGRSILIDGEPLLLRPEVLKDHADTDIVEWLEHSDEYSDGGDLDDIVDALKTAIRRALETIYEDAYTKGYMGEIEDAFGSKHKWIKIGGKDKLGFQVPWSKVRENMSFYEEENNERYSGDLVDLMIDYIPKLEPNDEYHGSLSDEPDTVKEALSYELGELEPLTLPENRPDPQQPELISGLPTGKKLHVVVYNEHYPDGATVTMKDYDWQKLKKEKPQETSKEAWDAYAKEHNIKPKSLTQEGLEPDDVSAKEFVGNLPVNYVIRQRVTQPGGESIDYWRSQGGGWTTLADDAEKFTARASAEQAVTDFTGFTVSHKLNVNTVIEPVYESTVQEAVDPDDIDAKQFLAKIPVAYVVMQHWQSSVRSHTNYWHSERGWERTPELGERYPTRQEAERELKVARSFGTSADENKWGITFAIEPVYESLVEDQKFEVRQVPITQLEPSEIHPDKPIDPAVFEQGWPAGMPPLFVFEGRGALSLQDGHNRWQAALEAGLKAVPVVAIPWTLAEQWYEEGLDRLDMRDRVFAQLGIRLSEAAEGAVVYRETDPEELDKLGVVTEFSDNAFGDFAYPGTHYLILKDGAPVGWFQQLNDGVLQVIEVKPEFQKQGIATEIVHQLYGDEEFRVSDPSEEGKRLFKRFPKHVVEARLEESHSYAVTLIKLPRQLADFVVNWGKVNIAEDWLYTEEDDDSYGRELEPHVTVKYGLTANQVPDELRKITATTRPFPVFFEKVSLFDTNPDYDVVKLDIDSPWLSDLNERVSKLPNEDKHPVYHPHCTIAYVKKGVATKLAGADPFATKEVKPQFTAAEMEFKGACEQDDDPDRVVEVIRFSTQKEPQAEAVQERVVAAALKIKGKVYTGVYHPDAMWDAWDKGAFPKYKTMDAFQMAWEDGKIHADEEGFVTSTGRFIGREEAFDIAAKAKQIDPKQLKKEGGLSFMPGDTPVLDAGDAMFEALDPDVIDPKEYAHKTPLEYAVKLVGPKGEDCGYLTQQGVLHLNPSWMGLRSLLNLQRFKYGNRYHTHVKPGFAVQILRRPRLKEAADPDDVNPREYLKGVTAKYFVVIRARDMMPAYYSERMNTWTWNKEDATPFDREIAIRVAEELTFTERDHVEIEPVTEALDPDAIDPKQYLKKAVRWPCAKCGRDLGAPESVIREYFSRHGHDPVHSLGHYDAEGSFEPDTSVTLTAELHGYDLADDSDSCAACGTSTMEKIQEAVDPDAVDPKQALKNVDVHYAIRKIGNPKLPPWWWNSQWGWGAHRARQRFDSRVEADDMIRERGLQGVGEVVPIIEESRTPDPFGGLPFPTDASQVISYLRKKRHRRPAVL
jgi:hypothetical protein